MKTLCYVYSENAQKRVKLPSNCIEHCNFYLLVYYKEDLAINSFYVIHKGHESVIYKIGVGD